MLMEACQEVPIHMMLGGLKCYLPNRVSAMEVMLSFRRRQWVVAILYIRRPISSPLSARINREA